MLECQTKEKMHPKYLIKICSLGTVGNDINPIVPMFKIKYITLKCCYFV